MSVRAVAGTVNFILRNENRETANPPVVFPDLVPTIDGRFTFSIWVKPLNNIPITLAVYAGTNGSQITLGHNGTNWYIATRGGAVGENSITFRAVTLNRWANISVGGIGSGVIVNFGLEDDSATPWTHPVIVGPAVSDFVTAINSPFDQFTLTAGAGYEISCFKFFKGNILGPLPMQQLGQTFAPEGSGGIPDIKPMWNSALRTPWDLSNTADPYADRNWAHGHAFTSISDPTNLVIGDDPAYMANATPCPTWVYPTIFPSSFIDPGNTPLVTTTFKAPQFFQFEDRGSIPPVDFQISSIIYYGSAFGGIDPGTAFNECWGLYKDDNGDEVATMSDPAYRFVPGDTAVVIPPGLAGPITATNMYKWQFGAQFVWNPVVPQGPTKTAFLAYTLLYVTYIGYPTGIPLRSAINLAGLFAIKKGTFIDVYNGGTELEIPNPTVRTALIGE